MAKHRRKSRDAPTKRSGTAFLLTDTAHDVLSVPGYTSLDKCPEIMTACYKIAQVIGSITIHLMENTPNGDIRIVNELSRKIDIAPDEYLNRTEWMQFIIMTLLLYGDGNSVVRVHTHDGYLTDLEPVPAASVSFQPMGRGYSISIGGQLYSPEEVLHFRYNPDPFNPWLGRGLRISLRDVANNLKQAAATEKGFMSSEWKPSVIVKVDALTEEFASAEGRKKLLESYVKSSGVGEPWLIPADQFEVEQIRPLSLQDLAISDVVQLDKRTVASIIGVPAFLLGVGSYSKDEWNSFVNTTVRPIVIGLQQEMTRKLILSPNWYIRFNYWSLLDWNMQDISAVLLSGADRGFINGNEWRDRIGLQPVEGLDKYRVLENYIPNEMSGSQKKLIQDGESV